MPSGTITVQGAISGLPTGARVWQATVTAAAAIDHTLTVNLASGFNAITVPTGATAVLIIPPSGNAQTLTLKGITGDTGLRIHKTAPTMLSFDSTALPASIGITAGGIVNGCIVSFI